MGIQKQVVSTRLDDELFEQLKSLAESENRTISNYVETVLKLHAQKILHDSRKV